MLASGELARSFALGFAFDLAAAAYALAPLVLWLALAPDRLARTLAYRRPLLRRVRAALLRTAASRRRGMAVLGRIRRALQLHRRRLPALHPRGPRQHLGELPGRPRALGALALLAAALTALAARGCGARPPRRSPGARRSRCVAPGRWRCRRHHCARRQRPEEPFDDDAANELAGNGLYEFFAANRRNELSFERTTRRCRCPRRSRWCARALAAQSVDGRRAHERVRRAPERQLNVVLVSVESLGAEFLGAYGDPRGLTPNLDRLARESLCSRSVYATGNRTVRGLEALSLALPPTPGHSIVRRPNNGVLFSLGSVFEDKGYGGALRLRRLRLLRQHERVLRRQRLPRRSTAATSRGADRVREHLGRGRRASVRPGARRDRPRAGGAAAAAVLRARDDDEQPPPVHVSRRAASTSRRAPAATAR